jgi:hypothetical protein
MNKERIIITGIVSALVFAGLLATGATDAIYFVAAIGFFILCIAYAAWCEKI